MPGENFDYEFTPPDAGSFWYHPHMNSVEQLGKGWVGALVDKLLDDEMTRRFNTLEAEYSSWLPSGRFGWPVELKIGD